MKLTISDLIIAAFAFGLLYNIIEARSEIVAAQTRRVEEEQRQIAVEAACRVLVEAKVVKRCLYLGGSNAADRSRTSP